MEKPRLDEEIGQLLRRLGMTVATAESATGGLIAKLLTDVAGSSDYFLGSVVAYHNLVKERLLGVAPETLAQLGAVSHQTAIEMAEGVRRLLGSDIAVSDTGIAGPGGATSGKVAGLFYIGLATAEGSWAWEHHFQGSREETRRQAADAALKTVRDHLLKMTG